MNNKIMLHTISTSKQASINLQLIATTDAVLFWQNGVILTIKNEPLVEKIVNITTHCYVLDNDIAARGLSNFIDNRIKIINMQQVVELTAQYYPQMCWE